jgi:hypothetical protein
MEEEIKAVCSCRMRLLSCSECASRGLGQVVACPNGVVGSRRLWLCDTIEDH